MRSLSMKMLKGCLPRGVHGRLISAADRSVRPPTTVPYTEEQQRLGRPLSPHVTIYKQDITAISSIMNRVAGVVLSIGFGALSTVALIYGDADGTVQSALAASPPGVTPLAKFLLAYPSIYHWLNAVRHQFWNLNPGYITLQCGPRSSRGLIGLALALSGVASLVELAPVENQARRADIKDDGPIKG